MTEAITFSDREQWLAARRENIGGSEIAALFGCQAEYQKSHYALWQEKSGRIKMPEIEGERPAWGLRLEAAIAEGAAEKYGWVILKGGYVWHRTVAGMACSLDYEIVGHVAPMPDDAPRPPGVLEIKNVDWLVHKSQWGDEPPTHVALQLQHQLACTGYDWGYVVSLVGGNRLAEPYYFERRPKIIAEIERRVADFWVSIHEHREPPVDGASSTAEALALMYPQAAPTRSVDIDGDNEAMDAFIRLKQARLEGRALDAEERAAKNLLVAKIGDAEIVRFGDIIVATCKTVARKENMVKASSSRVLRLKEEQ